MLRRSVAVLRTQHPSGNTRQETPNKKESGGNEVWKRTWYAEIKDFGEHRSRPLVIKLVLGYHLQALRLFSTTILILVPTATSPGEFAFYGKEFPRPGTGVGLGWGRKTYLCTFIQRFLIDHVCVHSHDLMSHKTTNVRPRIALVVLGISNADELRCETITVKYSGNETNTNIHTKVISTVTADNGLL